MDANMELSCDETPTSSSPSVPECKTLPRQTLQKKPLTCNEKKRKLSIDNEVPETSGNKSSKKGVLRKYIPELKKACYPDGVTQLTDKVEYRDPNNGKKDAPKPKKEELKKLASSLVKKYQEMYPGSYIDSGRITHYSSAGSGFTSYVLPEIQRYDHTEATEVLMQIKEKFEKRPHDCYMDTLYWICYQLFYESDDVNIVTRGHDILKILGVLNLTASLTPDLQQTLNDLRGLQSPRRKVASSTAASSPAHTVGGKSAVRPRDELFTGKGAGTVDFNMLNRSSSCINNDAQMNGVQVMNEVEGTLAESDACGTNHISAAYGGTDLPKRESDTEVDFHDIAPTDVTAEQESHGAVMWKQATFDWDRWGDKDILEWTDPLTPSDTDAEQRTDEGDPMDVSKGPILLREERSKTCNAPTTSSRCDSSENLAAQSVRDHTYMFIYGVTNHSLDAENFPNSHTYRGIAVDQTRFGRGEASDGQFGTVKNYLAAACSGAIPFGTGVVEQRYTMHDRGEIVKSAGHESGDLDELFAMYDTAEAAPLFDGRTEQMDANSCDNVDNDWLHGSFNSTGPTPAKQAHLSAGRGGELITDEEANQYDYLRSGLGNM